MSLTPIIEIVLKQGLTPEEIQDTFNEISLINGLSGMEASSSQTNVIYCGSDGEGKVDTEIKKIPNVVSVTYVPLP